MRPDYGNVMRSLVENDVEWVVIGANAAIAQGAPIGTIDLDLGYKRTRENARRLARALAPFHPRLRGVDELSSAFRLSAEAIHRGCNFTLVTDAGDVDLLGHIAGLGNYERMVENAVRLRLFGHSVQVMSLEDVIQSKKAAGRPKDRAVLPVLEATLKVNRDRESGDGA
jgi:predicted nucleotidyltransferase